jgi:hypothetical protein
VLNERGITQGKLVNKKRYLVIVGIVAAAVLLSILLYTTLANHRPVITRLAAEPEAVIPLGNCQIVCNATDPDGDELSYGWSSTGGGIAGEGATVTWTAPDSQGFYNVTVIVTDGLGGEVTDDVTVIVRPNRSPTISSLVADSGWTTPSGSLQVACTASDPDGDVLSYEWIATGGNISGTGEVVNWTAPQEVGIYNVTVAVKDGHGGADTTFLSLSVATRTPPVIEKLTVTAKEPKYLKTASFGYIVGRTKQYDIVCNVSDTSDGVSYNWSCESGAISGEGSVITWTAPDESLNRTTVTVIVSDIYGSMVSETAVFRVAACTSCTFG